MKKYASLLALSAAILLVGCEQTPSKPQSAAAQEAASVEANQQALISQIPPPRLTTSQERKNLVKRHERINGKQNMTGCIYLISHGTVMAFYPVNGKVTSLNAYLMAGERAVKRDLDLGEFNGQEITMEEQPDYDGAYGKNADGVFFFTADTDTYVEWAGEYLWSDSCLALNVQPTMTRVVK